jgi:hypothetical protein
VLAEQVDIVLPPAERQAFAAAVHPGPAKTAHRGERLRRTRNRRSIVRRRSSPFGSIPVTKDGVCATVRRVWPDALLNLCPPD